MLPIVINFLLAINMIVALLIILLVLMQRPKNEGLGAAFGGGMTENLFGAQTSNVLQTITRWLGAIFFGLTLLLSWLYVQKDLKGSALQHRLSAPTVIPPAATPMPMPAATSAPVKPGEALTTPELENSIKKLIEDAAKGSAKPEGTTPMPAAPGTPAPALENVPIPAPAPAPAPAAPEPAKPDAAKPAPEAAKPAPAPDAAKPADAPAPTPDKAPEAPKP